MKMLFIISLLFAINFSSCTKSKENSSKINSQSGIKNKENLNSAGVKEGANEFTVSYAQPRRIYKIEKEDLNNDGNKEIIVLSIAIDSTDKSNDFYNFDMMEVFSLDPEKKSFVKIFSDTVDYSNDCYFVDLANDTTKQILIGTSAGGNDSITSNGMFVFDMIAEGKINLLKYFDSGAPVVKDIKNDGSKEILVSDLFYGVMPQAEAVNFVKQIYKLENRNLVERNADFKEFYDAEINKAKENYYGMKRKVEMGMQTLNLSYPLYREAAEVIINYYAKGDEVNLKKFWDEEKESLKKNIPENEFMDLNNFILKALPSAKNA